MARFELRLLGGFRAAWDGVPLTKFYSDKVRALLAYLVVAQKPVRRELLLELFWPGYVRKSAQISLRVALSKLRQTLAPLELLTTTRKTVAFDVNHPEFWSDVLMLEAAQAQLDQGTVVEEAQGLYEGRFLEGFVLADCADFSAWRAEQVARYEQLVATLTEASQASHSVPNNLPRQLTLFVGRENTLQQLERMVSSKNYPLITLVGEGGVGKSRLALMLGEALLSHFRDGVWFVPLVGLSLPKDKGAEEQFDSLASTIGHTLNLTFHDKERPSTQLFRHLRQKEMLLICDNFEHLLSSSHDVKELGEQRAGDTTDFIWSLLQQARALCLVVTSRQPLGLQAEYRFQVEGLPLPPTENTPQVEDYKAYGALHLFIERAERSRMGLRLTAGDLATIRSICQAVGGLPLGIELAAALVEYLALEEIREAVAQDLDVLATRWGDLPPRHRSLRAVFESSWALLSTQEQHALATLSLFRGDFTRQAAMSVIQAKGSNTSRILYALVDKSLVRRTTGKRFELHELVRQFAFEKLTLDTDRWQQSEEGYAHYYLMFVAANEEALKRAASSTPLQKMRRELEHIHAAWHWAVAHLPEQLELLTHSLSGLAWLYQMVGLFQEGETLFDEAIQRVQRLRTQGQTEQNASLLSGLLCDLLIELAAIQERLGKYDMSFKHAKATILLADSKKRRAASHLATAHAYFRLADYPQSRIHIQSALELLAGEEKWLESQALLILSRLSGFDGHYQEANSYALSALTIQRQQRFHTHETSTLMHLGGTAMITGDLGLAWHYLSQALALANQIKWSYLQVSTQTNLGILLMNCGDYGQAEDYYLKSLTLSRQLGDRNSESHTLIMMGERHNELGQHQAAHQLTTQALAIAQEINHPYAQALALITLAHAQFGLGAYEQANATYQESLQRWQTINWSYYIMLSLAGLARVAHQQKKNTMPYLDQLLTYLEDDKVVSQIESPGHITLTCYHLLRAYGNHTRANTVLQQGINILKAQAAKITDARIQQMYLHDVPAHREMMLLGMAE